MSQGGYSNLSMGPLVGIGRESSDDAFNFDISLQNDGLKNFDIGNIVKIKNKRVSAFPDFLMDWVTRQLEEVVNKLTSLPTLHIVLPDFSGFDFKGYGDILNKFSEGKAKDNKDYATSVQSNSSIQNGTLK